MSRIENRNRPPRKTSTREAGEFSPAPGRQRVEAGPFEAKAVAFYTVPQLAIRWSVSRRHVDRFIASRDLIVTNFGRSVRVSAAEVARFEASRTAGK